MTVSDLLQVFSQILNLIIFIYFSIILIIAGFLDVIGLLIAAMGIFSSLVVSIIAATEKTRGR